MFESFLKKNFWQSLFTGTGNPGRTKFTFEELRVLSDVLSKNQVVTEANRALVVETIRSIAEFMIWGDQNEPRIFDYFLENNVMHYLHRVLQQPANRTGDVAKQVLQTLSIIIQNIRSETGTYFLFSNNHINNIVEIRFDFEDEEVLGYYISFLKTISLKLNARTVQFFFDRRESACTFPLYSEAVKFAHHKEGMVRAGVRTLTLNVYSVPDEDIQDFVSRPPATAYFAEMVSYIADQIKILDKRIAAAEGFSAQVLSSLDSQLAEVEDMVSYVADILAIAHPRLAHFVAEQLWVSLVGPYLLRPLLEYGSSKAVPRSNSGYRSTSASGTAPSSPGPAGSSPIVRAACSLYCLERLFVIITYPPLLHNLALAFLDPRIGHPSCRSALVSVLRSEDHRAVPAALRCLVAILQSRHIAPEVLALLGMVPRSRSADLHRVCAMCSCATCQLYEDLPALAGAYAAAGAPPDPLAEEAQPVATVASGAAGGSPLVFGYHLQWTHLERASEWALVQRGYSAESDRNSGGVTVSYEGTGAGDQAEPVPSESAVGDGGALAMEQVPAQVHTQDLLGGYMESTHTGDVAGSRAAVTLEQGGAYVWTAQQGMTMSSPLDHVASGSAAEGGTASGAQASGVDLLGLGDTGSSDTQPAAVYNTFAFSEARPPSATAAAGVQGALADLLGLCKADVAASFVPSSSKALTPSASLGTTLGTDTAPGATADHLLDNALEPSYLGPGQGTGTNVEPLEAWAESHLAAGTWSGKGSHPVTLVAAEKAAASGHARQGAEMEAAPLDGAGITPMRGAGLAATAPVYGALAYTPILDLVESLETLEVALRPAVQGMESFTPSGEQGSIPSNSVRIATTSAGALADTSTSVMLPSVLESGPGRPGTAAAGMDAAPSVAVQCTPTQAGRGPAAMTAPPPPPPPPAAPPPPSPAAPPPPPLLSGHPCAVHARPATVLGNTDVIDALFALLAMQLLPVQGLWHVCHLLQQLYPRVQELRELQKAVQQLQQQQNAEAVGSSGQAVANLLNLEGMGGSGAGAGEASPSSGLEEPQPRSQPPSPSHPLDPSSTVGWACELNSGQREALRVAAVSAASAVLDEVGGMWCDALVAMLVMEWPAAHDAVMRPVLRTGAEQLLAGPHLYPRQNMRGLSHANRNDQGLSGSAVAALHSYHAVARLVALLLVHDLLCKGTTERAPPATVPPPPGTDVDGREWDLLEGQEVELQAGAAIPCIVSFSPGQERRVYFAAAGPALRRVGEYLQHPQAMSDSGSQSVVLHSSPAVVLADPAPTRLNAGIVLSVSPLLGCDPCADKHVAKWLHVHVRPSVRGLLRLLRSATGGRKGGLLGALRQLVDGHWVLAFPDQERASNARQLVEQSAHRLRALYCELLSPVLSTVME